MLLDMKSEIYRLIRPNSKKAIAPESTSISEIISEAVKILLLTPSFILLNIGINLSAS